MSVSPLLVSVVLAVSTVASTPCLRAETWQGQLQGGGVIQVDPQTRKPTYYYNGGSTTLWDGVHQLNNGSVVIVRDGVVVPDEHMYHTWSSEEPRETLAQVPECERLVRKVCGFNSECFGTGPCGIALQLQRLEKEETANTPHGATTGATQECRKGLSDEALFPACGKTDAKKSTPCTDLVSRVCGDHGQCADTPACDPARQLLDMENKERLRSEDPNAATGSGEQCKEAMGNDFFKACGENPKPATAAAGGKQ